jgi:hypothetical protein
VRNHTNAKSSNSVFGRKWMIFQSKALKWVRLKTIASYIRRIPENSSAFLFQNNKGRCIIIFVSLVQIICERDFPDRGTKSLTSTDVKWI